MIAILCAAGLAACAASAPELASDHPARPGAAIGRLAGAPPALRPGVVVYDDVPELRTVAPPAHVHQHSP